VCKDKNLQIIVQNSTYVGEY